MPTACDAMPMRPPSRPDSAIFSPMAFVAEQVRGRHAAVLEQDLRGVARVLAHLVFDARHGVAGRVGRHDEGADALLAGRLVGDRHHDRDVAVLAAGDELLDAVEHVVRRRRARPSSSGPSASRADVRLGQAEGAEHVAARQRLAATAASARRWPSAIRIEHTGQLLTLTIVRGGAVAGGDLLEDQRQRQVVEPGAVPLGRHRDAVAAQLGQAAQLGLRKVVLLVPRAACGAMRSCT